MKKREPVAELGYDDYRIVRHTHDVELAARLMAEKLSEVEGGAYGPDDVGAPRQIYVRIVHALPGTYTMANDWKFQYQELPAPARGAFPAVVFW